MIDLRSDTLTMPDRGMLETILDQTGGRRQDPCSGERGG